MSIWVIVVKYIDRAEVNISQDAYVNYNDAVKSIRGRIDEQWIKQMDDYNFMDMDRDIIYTLKTVFARKEDL